MADTWTPISGYTPQDYTDTAVFEVNSDTKKIALITGQALVAGEENSQYIKFLMPRYWDGIDIKDKAFYVEYALAGTYYGKTAVVNAEYNDEKVRFGWVVPKEACCISGTLLFVLRIESEDYVLKTQIAEHPVYKSVNVEDVVPEPTKEAWYRDFAARVEVAIDEAEAALAQAQQAVVSAETAAQNAQTAEDNAEAAAASAQVRYGSPLVAQTAEEMIEGNRVYVYVGSETGYTNGHWYYYNGDAWADGGVYNGSAVNTDTTLTQAGMAADAKATGDAINTLYVTDSASGSVAHFVDGADDVPMKSVKVNIVPIQSGSGDPSPTNIRPISGKTSITLTRAGKNLVKPLSKTESGLTLTPQSDGGVLINGTYTGTTGWFVISSYVSLKAGQTYALSASGTENTIGLNGYGSANPVTPNADFTSNLRLRIENGQTFDNVMVYPQVEVGATPTEFEIGTSETTNISLSSAGTVYGGTLDVVSGELTVDKVATVGLSSYTQASGTSEGGLSYYNYAPSNYKLTESGGVPTNISSHLAMKNGNTAWASATPCATANATRLRLYIEAGTESSYADMVVVYTLATPLTYQLAATEIKSLPAINNIWSNAGDVDVEYRADTKLYIDKTKTSVDSPTVPSYFQAQLDTKVPQIIENMNACGENGETFVFITDTHWETNYHNSPKLIKYILNHTKINHIIHGGDLINQGEKMPMYQTIIEDIRAFQFGLCDNFLPIARGNHDDNSNWTAAEDITAHEFDYNTVFALLYKDIANKVTFIYPNNDFSFYYDSSSSKTRFIFVDMRRDGRYIPYEQLKVLLNATPADYKLVFVAHYIYYNNTFIQGATGLFSMISAFNAKTSGSYMGVNYDFTGSQGKAVCVLAGHTHEDFQWAKDDAVNVAGVPIIITDTDSYRNDAAIEGTVDSQCFDVVTIDYVNGTVKCVRIGRGQDRTLSFD